MFILKIPVCAVVGYLLGCVNISILISRTLLGKDVRSFGSGNAGATNMTRVFGWKPGLAALIGDAAKAALSLAVGRLAAGDLGMLAAGGACLLGHCFPLFYGFRGGKGVSAAAALAFAIDWRVGLCCVGAFLLGALWSRKVSLGSLIAAVVLFVSAAAFQASPPKLLLALFASVLVINRHAENIKRLLAGREPDFPSPKKRA